MWTEKANRENASSSPGEKAAADTGRYNNNNDV
jgi:hypothetical protein